MSYSPNDKLRAYMTREGELCSCAPPRVWKLMYALGDNPVCCTRCNLQIRPEELDLQESVVDLVVRWRDVWGALYRLWLDSGACEKWAATELMRLESHANQLGIDAARRLTQINPCYFQYFEDEGAEGWKPCQDCPSCGRELIAHKPGRFAHRVCDTCRLAFWGENGTVV